jgi:hypothetical protein
MNGFTIPYWEIYKEWAGGQIKTTLGKQYSRMIPLGDDKVWAAPSDLGGVISFVDDKSGPGKPLSFRFEYKPKFLKGLDVGAQWFLTDSSGQFYPEFKESLAEWGFGASYDSDLFKIVAGLRTDGKGDAGDIMHFIYGGQGVWLGGYDPYGINPSASPMIVSEVYTPAEKNDFMLSYMYFGGEAKALGKAVKGLDSTFGGYWANMQDFDNAGFWHFYINPTFDMNPLTKVPLSFNVDVNFNGFGKNVNLGFVTSVKDHIFTQISPQVTYTFGHGFSAMLKGSFGFMKDIIKGAQWSIQPELDWNISDPIPGVATIGLGYKLSENQWTYQTKAQYTHDIYLNVMYLF